MVELFFFTIWSFYLLFLCFSLIGWMRLKKIGYGKEGKHLRIAVIVPFRDERAHMERLVETFSKQVYTHFEVIFVNDHSTDGSERLLYTYLQEVSFNFRLVNLKKNTGKKAALTEGIGQTSAEIIVTTDADCWFGKYWLQLIDLAFSEREVQMVSAPVALADPPHAFGRWQQLEFASLIGVGAAFIGWKRPLMCNGANLAYRRSVFHEVDGFKGIDGIPSGDDELLMAKFHRQYPNGVRFLKEKAAVVWTYPVTTFSAFFNQRKRWAGKWNYGKRITTRLTALLVFLCYLSFVLGILWSVSGVFDWPFLLGFVGLKIFLEGLFLWKATQLTGIGFRAGLFMASQIFYPLYVIFFGIMANFGKYEWKGRSYPQ